MFRHDETVRFHPIVELLFLVGIAVVIWIFTMVPLLGWVSLAITGPLLLLPLVFGRLRIRVDHEALAAEFGLFGWPAQRVPLAAITSARVVTYHPIRNFGGWGVRFGRLDGEPSAVYSVRGKTAVLLTLSEARRIAGFRTRHFLVGSSEPDKLRAALDGT